MSSPVVTVTPETSVDDCCKVMEEDQVRRVLSWMRAAGAAEWCRRPTWPQAVRRRRRPRLSGRCLGEQVHRRASGVAERGSRSALTTQPTDRIREEKE